MPYSIQLANITRLKSHRAFCKKHQQRRPCAQRKNRDSRRVGYRTDAADGGEEIPAWRPRTEPASRIGSEPLRSRKNADHSGDRHRICAWPAEILRVVSAARDRRQPAPWPSIRENTRRSPANRWRSRRRSADERSGRFLHRFRTSEETVLTFFPPVIGRQRRHQGGDGSG